MSGFSVNQGGKAKRYRELGATGSPCCGGGGEGFVVSDLFMARCHCIRLS